MNTGATSNLPSSGEFADGAHRMVMRVYYEDTDTAGIVYYANYLRYIERARTEVLRLCGVDQFELMNQPPQDRVSFAVRRCEIDYLAPARLDDIIEVTTTLDKLGAAYIDMKQDISRGGETLIKSFVRAACLNAKGMPTRLPTRFVENVRRALPLNNE